MPGSTIGSRLRAARSSRFVGRQAELELFDRALDDPESAFAVLFVYGPPGVGKSTLVRELAARGSDRDRRVRHLDLRQVEATPEGLLGGLGVTMPPGSALADALREVDIVVLDTYELASPLDGWIREQLVPSLPAHALMLLAGRLAPSPEWSADPAWRPLVRAISLRNLRPEDATAMLVAEGIDVERRARILDETFGHPLAMCLYVDLLGQRQAETSGGSDIGLLDAPDVVHGLLHRFVNEVPGAAHRAALEVCAHVRFTTEELIRAALDAPHAGDAAGLFEWLRGLSFIDASPEGLFPHDLVRDLLDTDLRWRDAAAYQRLHMRTRRHLIDKVRSTSGRERHRAASDLVYLHRSNPLMRSFWDFSGLAQGYIDHLRPGDTERLRAMVDAHEGPASVTILDHWLERQPQGFAVMRLGADTSPRGFTAMIDLDSCSAEDLGADPGARAMWHHAQRHARPAPGEAVTACRFIVDRDAHQTPGSLTFGLTSVFHLQHILTRGDRAIDFIGGIAQPEDFDPVFTYIDFVRVPQSGYESGGRQWTVYMHDWRRQDVDAWFEMIADRELGAPVDPAAPEPVPTIALSQPDFADAVRAALRDLQRPDRLRRSPLLRSRLVDADPADAPAALTTLLRETIEALGDDPRTEKHRRALDRTFVRPAPNQERAAEVLGLPFSTYRRHLTRGVDLLIAALWDRELYRTSDRVGPVLGSVAPAAR